MKLAFACLCVGFAASARGADFVVVNGQSIQAAIAQAAPGDRVLVQPGRYDEAIDFLGKGIEVIGVDGAAVTRLDAKGLNTCAVRMMSGEPASTRLVGLHISGGKGIPNAYPPAASAGGAGIAAYGAAASIEDCIIEGNNAAGGYGGGGVFTGCTLRRCIIRSNTADTGGGAVDGTLVECTIQSNSGFISAGAHFSRLERCIVRKNVAVGSPGGAWTDYAADTWFEGNIASGNNGGGLRLSSAAGSTPRAERCVFRANYSANWGGGLHVLTTSTTVTPVIEHCAFVANSAAGLGGGLAGNAAFVDSCTFDGNSSDTDGFQVTFTSLFAAHSQATFVNCTFRNGKFNNSAVKPFGTVSIRHVTPGTSLPLPMEFLHCVLDGDDARVADNQELHVRASVVVGLIAPFLFSPPTVLVDNLSDTVSGPGWITAQPQFFAASANDHHLTASSPCIGAVTQPIAVGDDFEDDPRSAISDIGADEFVPHLYVHGLPSAGAQVALRVVGGPGDPAFLFLAPDLLPAPVPTQYGPFALGPTLLFGGAISLGVVPASGIIDIPGTIPANTPSFTLLHAQAVVLGGSNVLTNVASIDVR